MSGPASKLQNLDCTFESDTCGWKQDQSDDFDWTRNAGLIENGDRYSQLESDHTYGNASGHYMYINYKGQQGRTARLESPEIPANTEFCLSLWYFMHVHTETFLRVYVRVGSTLSDPLLNRHCNHAVYWHQAEATVPAQARKSSLVIEGVHGEDRYSDIAVDDVSVTPGPCPVRPPGQLPNLNCSSEMDAETETCTWYDASWAGSHSLQSPEVPANTGYCFRFAYQVIGSKDDKLTVYEEKEGRWHDPTPLVEVTGGEGSGWLTQTFNVPPKWYKHSLLIEQELVSAGANISVSNITATQAPCFPHTA